MARAEARRRPASGEKTEMMRSSAFIQVPL